MAQTATDVLTKLQELLTKLLEPPVEEAPPEKPVAKSIAERARAKYDRLVRWILSVLTAIGVLIFGSLPFVDLKDVSPALVVVGLLLAGLGICVVVWAVTKGLEPIDASLGELKRTLDAVADEKEEHGEEAVRPKRPAWWHAQWNSTLELYRILNGDERQAHLGPGVTSVGGLIDRIGVLESALLQTKVGWDPATTPPDRADETWSASFLGRQAAWEGLGPELAAALKRADDGAADDTTVDPLARAFMVSYWQRQYLKLSAANPAGALTNAIAAQEAIGAALQTYRGHRTLLLQESAVAQLRGTFRWVRGWLMIGGCLTLVGGTTYAFGIANPTTVQPPNTSIVVDLTVNSNPWKALSSCRRNETADIKALAGLLYSERKGPEAQDGNFTFIVTDPRCKASQVGMIIEVTPSEGAYDVARGPAELGGSASGVAS